MEVVLEAFLMATGIPLPADLQNDIGDYLPWVQTPSAQAISPHFRRTPVDFDKVPISECTKVQVPPVLRDWRMTIEYFDWRMGLLAMDRGPAAFYQWNRNRFRFRYILPFGSL